MTNNIWDILTTIGTVGATLIALTLAYNGWARDKDATARLVSAWITDEYKPRSNGSSYERVTHLHISNEANEPVFKAMVNVLAGKKLTRLGSLTAPHTISVLPPRRELIFDISIPLLAHDHFWSLSADLTFTDPKGHIWVREGNGDLHDVSGQSQHWSKEPVEFDEAQLGNNLSTLNPMAIALNFLTALAKKDLRETEGFRALLAPEASGWNIVDWDQLNSELTDFLPTSMVNYPTPRIAYIKLSGDPNLEGKCVEGHGTSIALSNYRILTLTLTPGWGWKVYAVGEVPPNEIYFADTLAKDVLSPFNEDS